MSFELSAAGGLVPPGTVPGVDGVPILNSVAPTSYSEVSNFQGSSPVDATDAGEPLTATSFATAPFDRGLTVIGQPSVHFTLRSTSGEAIVFWKVYDQAPDGSYELVHHLVTPIRVNGEGEWPAYAPITEPVDIRLGLQSIVHRFEPGHRLVLTAATTDTAHYGSRIPAVYLIGGGSAARLTLPVLG
jgi:ABC-2 type transport system ATP-binding protein